MRRRLVLLAGALAALTLSGGSLRAASGLPSILPAEKTVAAAPEAIDPAELQAGWSKALRPDTPELESRVEQTLAIAARRVAALPEERRSRVEPVLERLALNLRGYLRLIRREAEDAPQASTLQDSYTIDDVLRIDRALRRSRSLLESDRAELESRRRSVAALTRQADNLFAAYLDKPARSAEGLEAGIQVMATRAALLLEEQQVRLLSAQVEARKSRVSQGEEEVDTARTRLQPDAESDPVIQAAIARAESALAQTRRLQRQAEARLIEIVATSDPDSPAVALSREEVRLRSVREARMEAELQTLQARADLLMLSQDMAEEIVAAALDRQSERAASLERIRNRLSGWRESADQGLSESAEAIAGESREEILEKRAATAASTLGEIQALRAAVGDGALLQELVAAELVARRGRIVGFLSDLGQGLAGTWGKISDVATSSLVAIGDTPVTLAGILRVLLILTLAFWVSRIVRHALDRMGASRRTAMSPSSLYSLGRLLHYVIVIAAIIIGLASIGLDFTNLALVASALGIGIGFGLQSIVSNFVSGLILLFERSLNVGDFVELDSGVTGMIKEINVRSTLLNTNDNVDILVPNSEFVNGRLINWTLREAVKRVHISFGVAYGTDKDLTRKAALEAAERVPLTLTGPGREPQVWLVNFGDSSLDYELVVWLGPDAVRRPAAVQAAYLWEIETSLAEHGIEIPFPQRDLHLRSGMEALATKEGNN